MGSVSLAENVEKVRRRIVAACRVSGRDPADVRLLLATKTVPVERIREVLALGEALFGENRVQELAAKAPLLRDTSAAWHMIGHLQTNKVRQVVEWAEVIQSVDRPHLVEALDHELEKRGGTLDVFLQVNTSGEAEKSGVAPEGAEELARRIARSPRLRLRGLMTIPRASEDPEGARPSFRLLRELRDRLSSSGLGPIPELSMGMSGDLEVAVEEGSTIVRVGTAVFGERTPS